MYFRQFQKFAFCFESMLFKIIVFNQNYIFSRIDNFYTPKNIFFNLLDSFFGFGVSSNDVILLSPELECPDTSSDTKFEFDEFESDTLPESVDDRVG